MKVENMTSSNGNKVANQFIITDRVKNGALWDVVEYFQSYKTIIVKKTYLGGGAIKIELDRNKWDYSTTTGKYRNLFLGETKRETEKKIKSGEYILTNLN